MGVIVCLSILALLELTHISADSMALVIDHSTAQIEDHHLYCTSRSTDGGLNDNLTIEEK